MNFISFHILSSSLVKKHNIILISCVLDIKCKWVYKYSDVNDNDHRSIEAHSNW